ncbi:MAG: hypothetical protein ACTHJQ_23805 [Rhizobiaceae bacterium]|jgi:hypothetical protein
MRHQVPTDVFKPKPTASEKKGDVTTRAAQAIMHEEASARDAKTERLRAARLAREATEGPQVQKIPAKKKSARKS